MHNASEKSSIGRYFNIWVLFALIMYLSGMVYLLIKSTPLVYTVMDLIGSRDAYAKREADFTIEKLVVLNK